MAKIYLDEIDATMTSTMFSSLKGDSSDSLKIDNNLDSFVNNKEYLVGPQWDKVRSKMAEYKSAFEKRTVIGEKLSNAINEALTLLKNYLGDDLMLDSSMLDEYKNARTACNASIEQLKSMLNEKKEVEKIVDGKKVITYENVYNVTEIKKQLLLAEDTLKELDRIIDKIIHLDEVYKQAEAILAEVFSDIDEFSNMVSNIVPSSKVMYNGV